MNTQSPSPRRSPSLTSCHSAWSNSSDMANSTSGATSTYTGTTLHQDTSATTTQQYQHQQHQYHQQQLRDQRQGSDSSIRSCEDLSLDKTQHLWQSMLQLQEKYGCYNSTRIDLAVDAPPDEALDLMPNRFIIDTLNNSLHDLPSEGWQILYRCLDTQAALSTKAKPSRKFWTKRH